MIPFFLFTITSGPAGEVLDLCDAYSESLMPELTSASIMPDRTSAAHCED